MSAKNACRNVNGWRRSGPRVGQPRLELVPPVLGLVQSLRERVHRRAARILVLALAPLQEGAGHRKRAASSELEHFAALGILFPDRIFEGLLHSVQHERRHDELWLVIQRLFEFASNVRPDMLRATKASARKS